MLLSRSPKAANQDIVHYYRSFPKITWDTRTLWPILEVRLIQAGNQASCGWVWLECSVDCSSSTTTTKIHLKRVPIDLTLASNSLTIHCTSSEAETPPSSTSYLPLKRRCTILTLIMAKTALTTSRSTEYPLLLIIKSNLAFTRNLRISCVHKPCFYTVNAILYKMASECDHQVLGV